MCVGVSIFVKNRMVHIKENAVTFSLSHPPNPNLYKSYLATKNYLMLKALGGLVYVGS